MKVLMMLCLATLCLNFKRGASESPLCSLPPSRWCSSSDSALQCGVLKQCLQNNLTRFGQRAEPVQVGIYYETLCPDCILFMTQVLFPTFVLLQDIMTLTLVPYGNAKEKQQGTEYIFKCQHGKDECLGNMIQACLLDESENAFEIIYCMESAPDVIKAAKTCTNLYSPDLNWGSIMSCVNGDRGNRLMHENALQTEALDPPHTSVPWVTINGKHTDELQKKALSSLFTLVCSTYEGSKPEACGGSQ